MFKLLLESFKKICLHTTLILKLCAKNRAKFSERNLQLVDTKTTGCFAEEIWWAWPPSAPAWMQMAVALYRWKKCWKALSIQKSFRNSCIAWPLGMKKDWRDISCVDFLLLCMSAWDRSQGQEWKECVKKSPLALDEDVHHLLFNRWPFDRVSSQPRTSSETMCRGECCSHDLTDQDMVKKWLISVASTKFKLTDFGRQMSSFRDLMKFSSKREIPFVLRLFTTLAHIHIPKLQQLTRGKGYFRMVQISMKNLTMDLNDLQGWDHLQRTGRRSLRWSVDPWQERIFHRLLVNGPNRSPNFIPICDAVPHVDFRSGICHNLVGCKFLFGWVQLNTDLHISRVLDGSILTESLQ